MIFAFGYYMISFLVSLVNPFWGLVGFVCSLLLRFQDHYPQIMVIKPFTFLLFGMLLGCLLNKEKLAIANWFQDKLILALLVISMVGLSLLAPSELVNETYLFLCSISLYFFASRILQSPSQFLILFIAMAASISYLAYLAIIDINLNGELSSYIDPRSGRWQGFGYYQNSNEFGQLMITTVPFLLAIIMASKSLILKLLSIAMMLVMLFVMIQCASRTVMVTFALMIVLTFMLRGKGNLIKKVMIGASMSLLLLGVLTFMPGPIQERMSTVLDARSDESFQGRTRAWGYGFDMLSWYPITGVGKGQWMEYHGLMPHNSYVQIMAELGIFGIIVFIWLLLRSFTQFSPILVNNSTTDPPSIELDLFGDNELEELKPDQKDSDVILPEKEVKQIDNFSRTIAIAVLVTFSAWLFYIFLGNQGYSVWTYFYIGLCAAVQNFLPQKEIIQDKPLFEESEY